MKKALIRTISIILVLSFCLAPVAMARASDYIKSCSIITSASGTGKIDFKFSVIGTGTMTEIGSTKIEVKNASGLTVKTFRYTDVGYSYMMSGNKTIHSGTVTFSGVTGNKYYAVAYFKAGNSSGSDTDSATSSFATA